MAQSGARSIELSELSHGHVVKHKAHLSDSAMAYWRLVEASIMKSWIGGFTLVVALAIGGCRGGGSDSPSATAVSEDEYRFIAATIANAVLITDADVPDEFTPVAEDPADDASPDPAFALTGECEEFNPYFKIETDWLSSAVEVEGSEFEDQAENSVSSGAAVFLDEAGMREDLELNDELLEMCGDQLESGIEAYYRELAANAGNTLTNTNVEFSKLPDQTAATRRERPA